VTDTSVSPSVAHVPAGALDRLATLFDLGRHVTSVLDLDELLRTIPELVSRVITFDAFAVYLLDTRRAELRIAYPVGYPAGAADEVRLKVGEGLVGHAVEHATPILANDAIRDPRWKAIVPGMRSAIVVPLVYKGRVIGALNVLSHLPSPFTQDDLNMLRQFAVHVAVAIENARLFEREREDAELFATLAEIGRDVSAVLDLDELLTRIAQLAKRVIAYRTFGIMLVNEAGTELEMKVAVQYGQCERALRVRLGEGLVGFAALHKEAVLVPDVSQDPRYINVVEDVRSELVVPLLHKGRCIGVFDLESPELDAFGARHVEALTVLASQAAVAIENARLYETVRANEDRLEREVRFAQRVQAALLPSSLPKRFKGVDVAARFAPARELGGDFYEFLSPEAHTLVVALGDVSGKGVPAALYSAFAGELLRSRTFRRRYTPERATPAAVLGVMNTILHERQLEEYYCTLCYASFDVKRRHVTFANSGLPYPVACHAGVCRPIEIPGVPLGTFAGTTYDEVTLPLEAGDLFVFASDGVFDAVNEEGREFGTDGLLALLDGQRSATAGAIVDAVFEAVAAHQGRAPQHDDMSIVAVRICQ
jgi:sigma-B regulation protein RsbU (phosphoserine phosphatase)